MRRSEPAEEIRVRIGVGAGGGASRRGLTREVVLDGTVRGEELRGEAVLPDAGVGTREGVLPLAERADPDGRAIINAGVGIDDGATIRAVEGIVGQQGDVRERAQRSVHDGEGDDQVCRRC